MKIFLAILVLLASSCAAQIRTFDDCMNSGGIMQKTYPAKCISKDGQVFISAPQVEKLEQALCVNKCGDGECQEIVCMGTGCPCAETSASCPSDCKA